MICSAVECERGAYTRGICLMHYKRIWRDDPAKLPSPPQVSMPCRTPECASLAGARSGLCRPCYHRDYERRNADRVRENHAAAYQRNRDAVIARTSEYGSAHPEMRKAANRKYHAEKPERVAANQARYSRTETGLLKRREKNLRRKALMLGATVTKADYRAILDDHGFNCHICQLPINGMGDLDFDHVVPLARGGAHSTENILPAHRTCNRRKGARLMTEIAA